MLKSQYFRKKSVPAGPGAIFLSEKLAFFRIIPYIYMLPARFTAP